MVSVVQWWQLPGKVMFRINRKANELLWNILVDRFSNIKTATEKIAEHAEFSSTSIKNSKCYRYYDKDLLVEICKLCHVSLRSIEQNILSYSVPSSVKVVNPKLPLKVSVLFDNITAHMMADGGELRDGGGTYKQKNYETAKNFVEKLKFIFGDYLLAKSQRRILNDNGYFKVPIPKVFVQTIKQVYDIPVFETTQSQIPKEIFKKSRTSRLAFLLAFIVDECSAKRDRLIFSQKNKKLTFGLWKILKNLGYRPRKIRKDKKGNFRFYLYAPELLKLWLEIVSISKKFPLLTLAHKKLDIEKVLRKHISQKWIKTLLLISEIQNEEELCDTVKLYKRMRVYRSIAYDKIKRLVRWGYLKEIGRGKQRLLLFQLTPSGRKVASIYLKAYNILGEKYG